MYRFITFSFLFLFSFLVSQNSFAVPRSQVIEVEEIVAPHGWETRYEIMAKNGRIYFVSYLERNLLPMLAMARDQRRPALIVTNDADTYILDVIRVLKATEEYSAPQEVPPQQQFQHRSSRQTQEQFSQGQGGRFPHYTSSFSFSGYQGSELSLPEVNELFVNLSAKDKRGFMGLGRAQCYQRAHFWSYQMWQTRKVKSYKVFLFYTKRYMKTYSDKWWFHVAPMIFVNGNAVMMDRTFLTQPTTLEEWKNLFIVDGHTCKIMTHYKELDEANRGMNEWCLIRIMPMYYNQPLDVKNYDLSARSLNDWTNADVTMAIKGFKK